MRAFTLALTSLCVPALVGAQGLLTKPAVQHATVTAAASSITVSAGGKVTLYADVTPYPKVSIYAEGAKDFTPVSIVITPTGAVAAGTPVYPKAERVISPGSVESVPAYRKTFRVAVPVTVKATAKAGESIVVGGAVRYQACDDRLCYPVTAAPVTWTFTVK